ncbi:MAG: hypothetical protein Terrestrivirus2_197 [Terrestrivirus sp.]|uniref:Uncharacterized protein n=1 Tax=Terrestrivirus sp. TaxID=2487775 RepID=A0A3G4ZQH2_9VIRU|nr:MAG: hypothetical protein Terrestrivirus2_197 [Terrestrivirus sp.]
MSTKFIKYNVIDTSLDRFCTGGYLIEILSVNDLKNIHNNSNNNNISSYINAYRFIRGISNEINKSENRITLHKSNNNPINVFDLGFSITNMHMNPNMNNNINPNISTRHTFPGAHGSSSALKRSNPLITILHDTLENNNNNGNTKSDSTKTGGLALTMNYFIKLISNSKIDEMREILEQDKQQNIYINMCDEDNDSLLHFSVFANNYEITKLLLKYSIDANKRDNDGQTALFRVVFGDNDKIIGLLLEYGAMIDIIDSDGNTALHIAVSTKNYLMIKSLLEYGAKTNIANKEHLLPIDYAVIKKDNIISVDQSIIDLFNKFAK